MEYQSFKLENSSKKILFFITACFPYGKEETFIENEIKYLSKSFDKIIIISHNIDSHEQRKTDHNIDVIRIPYNIGRFGKVVSIIGIFNKYFWKEIKTIKKEYHKNISIGIIKTMLISLYNGKRLSKQYTKIISKHSNNKMENYFYSYWCNDSALALTYIKMKNPRFKTFFRIHGWDVYFEASSINYLPFRQFIADKCDKIFAISKAGKNYAIEKWKTKSNQIQISRLGISNNYKLNLNEQKKTIHLVSCSNIIAIKRVHLIAEALKQMNNIKFKWTHFGDGDERNIVESLIKTLPKSIDVILKGRVSNNKIYSFYHLESPNLFINLSSSEGVPVSIMEAMSFGIPVIATAVGGTPEIVNDRNGYLISKNPSTKEITEIIQDFLNLSGPERLKKQKSAYLTWQEKYNAKTNYTQFIEDILSL